VKHRAKVAEKIHKILRHFSRKI